MCDQPLQWQCFSKYVQHIQNGNASGLFDPVVGEMIKLIPYFVMSQIVALFNLRFLGEHIETIESWRRILPVLIPKEKDLDFFR